MRMNPPARNAKEYDSVWFPVLGGSTEVKYTRIAPRDMLSNPHNFSAIVKLIGDSLLNDITRQHLVFEDCFKLFALLLLFF